MQDRFVKKKISGNTLVLKLSKDKDIIYTYSNLKHSCCLDFHLNGIYRKRRFGWLITQTSCGKPCVLICFKIKKEQKKVTYFSGYFSEKIDKLKIMSLHPKYIHYITFLLSLPSDQKHTNMNACAQFATVNACTHIWKHNQDKHTHTHTQHKHMEIQRLNHTDVSI